MSGAKVILIEEYQEKKLEKQLELKEHEVAHLICLDCKKRWLGVYPTKILLVDMKCPYCNKRGLIIKTGQTLLEEGDNYD